MTAASVRQCRLLCRANQIVLGAEENMQRCYPLVVNSDGHVWQPVPAVSSAATSSVFAGTLARPQLVLP